MADDDSGNDPTSAISNSTAMAIHKGASAYRKSVDRSRVAPKRCAASTMAAALLSDKRPERRGLEQQRSERHRDRLHEHDHDLVADRRQGRSPGEDLSRHHPGELHQPH